MEGPGRLLQDSRLWISLLRAGLTWVLEIAAWPVLGFGFRDLGLRVQGLTI